MATVEQTKTALQQISPQKTMRDAVQAAAKELSLALPKHMNANRLVRIALTCTRQTPKLLQCTQESFLGALFTAAQLGVEPIAGRAYLIPFRNSYKEGREWKSRLDAQFVMGYRGLAELFYRHEKSVMLNWGVVKDKDVFEYELGTNAFLKHIPAKGDRGATVGFYVIADLGGAKPFHYMSLDECMEHGRKHSKTYLKETKDRKAGFVPDSPWSTNPEAMCLKTVLIQLCKVLPLSFELQTAIEHDESSREYRKGVGDVLDTPSSTSWATEDEPEPKKALGEPKKQGSVEPTRETVDPKTGEILDEPPEEAGETTDDIPFGQ